MKRTLHFFIVLCLVVFIGRNLNAFELVPICYDLFDQTNPAIYGDKIAWIDKWREATFGAEYIGGEVVYNDTKRIPSVCIYDLKSKLMSCIAIEKTPVHIAMYEDKLVLELDDEGVRGYPMWKDIYMFDLKQLTFKMPSDEKSYIDSLEPTSDLFYDRKQNIVVEVEYDKGEFERIVGVYYGDPATWDAVIHAVIP